MIKCLLIDWNVVSALANVFMACGVFLAYRQLLTTKRIAQMQFEDGLAKEYRDLAARIPTKVFYGVNLSDEQFKLNRDEFFHYIDLCNEQVSLRERNRISSGVWRSWRDGIKYNLGMPAFARAWAEIKMSTESFAELRRLERSGFCADPLSWNDES